MSERKRITGYQLYSPQVRVNRFYADVEKAERAFHRIIGKYAGRYNVFLNTVYDYECDATGEWVIYPDCHDRYMQHIAEGISR